MRIDYTTGGLDLVSSILDANSQRLSRTRGGVSDTSTSAEKERLTVSGNELAEQSRKNEARVHALLFERRDSFNPQGPADVLQLLLEIADGTNDNLLPSNRWRRWDVPSHGEGRDEFSQRALLSAAIPFTSVEAALEEFVQVVFEHWSTLEADPVPLASWAEWQLNAGPLHPFYDGCGRISRLFSAALFLRASWLLPMYDSRETYFERANRGTASFAGYVRERITACQSYLSSNGSFTIVTRQ